MAIRILAMLCLTAAAFGTAAFAQEARQSGGAPSVLVVYFSKTSNTQSIAEQIHSQVGGDIFQVRTRKPYPDDYRETTQVARVEQDNNERPELAETISVEDMKKYDVVFLGYPNWWGTIPMAFFTFLDQHDLGGKTVIPFCTHEGRGLGRGPSDIQRLCPEATLRQGLAIRGGSVGRAQGDVTNWLRQLGYVE